jgi:cytoskeletal protein CcmA (bactofilin family)
MLFDTPQVADLFFYQKDGKIYHVGMVGGVINNIITVADAVTIDEKGNVIREVNVRNIDMNSTYWKSHIAGFGRVIE